MRAVASLWVPRWETRTSGVYRQSSHGAGAWPGRREGAGVVVRKGYKAYFPCSLFLFPSQTDQPHSFLLR